MNAPTDFQNQNLLAPEQRTEQWYQDRSGKFTGSRFVDVLARGKKAYDDLIDQLVVERLNGEYIDSGMDSYALKWGREVEPYARQAYQFETGNIVTQAAFIGHKVYPFVGVSPDGLVEPDGGTEFKCPRNPAIHLARFRDGMKESEFMPQVQGCIWVCERDWWDWVSFDPRFQGERQYLRFYRQRVYRDEKYIAALEKAILIAEGEVRKQVEQYSREKVEAVLEKMAA